jgi:hypothetical protein
MFFLKLRDLVTHVFWLFLIVSLFSETNLSLPVRLRTLLNLKNQWYDR